jgi:hypothetical protein
LMCWQPNSPSSAYQQHLTAGDCADDIKRFASGCYRLRQRRICGLVRNVLAARKEPQQRTSLSCNVVADGPTQHRIPRFQRIKYRVSRHWTINVEFDISCHTRKRS